MIRRTFKAIGWIVGPILGLGIAAYVVAVAINWRDRAPSEAAIRLANAYRDRPTIADEDNAFIYAMGFGVAPEENPFTMGLKRIAWMERSSDGAPPEKDPLSESPDYRQTRHAVIKEFIEACRPDSSRCNDAVLAGDEVFERWIASEGWLLERYRALIAHAGWREEPFRLDTPLPPYALIIDGQRQLLLNAKKLARRGDHATVRNVLEQDVRFWRVVLESSDTLISKMIATAALNRHFALGNLVLREFADENAARAMPVEWSTTIPNSERSLRRCLIGEWVFSSTLRRQRPSGHFWQDDEADFLQEPSTFDVLLAWISGPLYQPQDSINDCAEHYSRMAEILDAPVLNYEKALDEVTAITERRQRDGLMSHSLYNMVGRRLIANGSFDFGSYAWRVNDIEGLRRAALAAVKLREQNVQARDVAAALETAPYRNPYDDRPFVWDAQEGAILFTGLEPGERGKHRIRY